MPLVTTDSSGAVATPTGYTTLGFPGQTRTLADLYYNRYRDYDSSLGRYIQADPIGLGGGDNPYLCAGANPLKSVDPFGLAYFAYRPLSGFPWLDDFDNPVDDALNLGLYHEQLFFEDGKTPSNVGFFEDGALKTDLNPRGYHRIPGHYNDCVMRQAVKNVRLRHYNLLRNNCQHWAQMVREEYYRLMKTKDCSCF